MSQQEMKVIPDHIIKKVIFALIITLVGTTGVMFFMGTFSKPTLEFKVTDPYRLAYISHTGPYNNIDGLIEELRVKMDEANVEVIDAAVLFLDDASEVKLEDQQSKVGFIIPVNVRVPDEFEIMDIPSSKKLVGTFNGGALMGSYRTYPAMQEWAASKGKRLSLPALEIYHGKSSVEYHMAIVD